MLELGQLDVKDAQLVQHGLRALGLYSGTTFGRPGPLTAAAYAEYRGQTRTGHFAEELARVAEGEVGTREEGNNGGVRIRDYQRATWLPVGPWPWCAAFVCWCFQTAAARTEPGVPRPQTAGAWDFERWARKVGAELLKPPGPARRGDIVVFRFSHIGIVERDEVEGRGYLYTIEGNTDGAGGREGDGVWRKTRPASQVRSLIRV